MSEKLYRLLLRLYPAGFRSRYAGEAMQVFRDRLRDERGLLKRIRLWLDVLFDVFLSAPREHSRAPSRPVPSAGGLPSFMVLEEEPLRPDKFLFGTLLALIALGTFGYLLTHGGNGVVFPGMPDQPLRTAVAPALSAGGTAEHPASTPAGEAIHVPPLTAAERELVIRRVIAAVRKYDPAESQGVTEFLEEQESLDDYSGTLNGPDFATLLTRQLGGVTRYETVTLLCGQEPPRSSAMWIVPSHPGERVWQRIDDHFSVALAPVVARTGSQP